MTVCIAAIYNKNSILGAADEMLTAGDIEFEPPQQSKIHPITNSIVAMTAGDANIQTQLFNKTYQEINKRISKNPDKWISVVDVAELYSKYYLEIKANAVQNEIFSLYGLTSETFISNQRKMTKDFIENITYKIQQHKIADVATIITGVDEDGPHIFVVQNSKIRWLDSVGFASVGIGEYHALSHFMLSKYTPNAIEAKALITVHQAKKKSEVSPGVGERTDMFVIGPALGTYKELGIINGQNIIKDLENFYNKHAKAIEKLNKKDEEHVKKYLENLILPEHPTQEINATKVVKKRK
jgi:20S proteasome alpha/beta subunit